MQSQATLDAETMVEPIRDLLNARGLSNAQALLALATAYDSILASSLAAPTQPEVMGVIHDNLRMMCETASLDAVLESSSRFLVDSARALVLMNHPDATP